jgi:hypothetical protein
MPASAGRVRMPHNNRMSTSGSLKSTAIWQTIGHDPYANDEERAQTQQAGANSEANAEKARSVLELARNQNVTDGAKRDNFTAQMFLGLKRGKQRRNAADQAAGGVDPQLQGMLEDPSSSSEEEFVEAELEKKLKSKKSRKDKKKKHRKRSKHNSSSSSDDDDEESSSSSDESSRRERRKRKRSKHKRKSKHRKRSRESSDDSSSDESDHDKRRRRRKEKRHKKERSDRDKRSKTS